MYHISKCVCMHLGHIFNTLSCITIFGSDGTNGEALHIVAVFLPACVAHAK